MFKPKGVIFLALVFILLSLSCSVRDSDLPLLTAVLTLHLEEHIDDTRIESFEISEDLLTPVEWDFSKPQPDWKPVKPIPAQVEAVKPVRVDDALRLPLSEANSFTSTMVGVICIDLPDWNLEDWAYVDITARTKDPMQRIGLYLNYTEDKVNPAFPFYSLPDGTPLITDGTVQTYSLLPHRQGEGIRRLEAPWTQLGIWFYSQADEEVVTLDILSVKVFPRPRPDHSNVAYGQHDRNVLDLWLAKRNSPTPLVIYYHGGGFLEGDKSSLDPKLLKMLIENGISVAAANYRLSGVAPYPAQMHDAARALQFLRLHAKEYNIDPERVGATGGSAGAGISQWLAFHDDVADPSNEDPLLRQSTRLTAVVPLNAQTSYDPRFIMKLMNTDEIHPALIQFFGMNSAADVDDPKFYPLFEDSSPINHLTVDDPPILFYFSTPNDPLPPNSPEELRIHHPKFGFLLKEKADELGVECIILLPEQFLEEQPVERFVEFFKEKLMK